MKALLACWLTAIAVLVSKRRDAMAVAAAPYLHAKMSAVEPKLEKPGAAEEHGILVRFVRPTPRPEDDNDVAMGNSLTP